MDYFYFFYYFDYLIFELINLEILRCSVNNLENLVVGKNGAGTAFVYFNLVKVGIELFSEILIINGYLEYNEDNNYKSTIVTFYFNIKELKDSTDEVRPQSFYMEKGRDTLKLHYPMVIFCDEDNYKEIKKIRDFCGHLIY